MSTTALHHKVQYFTAEQKLFFSLELLDHCSEKGFIVLFLIFVKLLVSFYNTFFGFLFEDKKQILLDIYSPLSPQNSHGEAHTPHKHTHLSL